MIPGTGMTLIVSILNSANQEEFHFSQGLAPGIRFPVLPAEGAETIWTIPGRGDIRTLVAKVHYNVQIDTQNNVTTIVTVSCQRI